MATVMADDSDSRKMVVPKNLPETTQLCNLYSINNSINNDILIVYFNA